MSVHHYSLFGLSVRSDLELPELVASNEQRSDVAFRSGKVELPDDAAPGVHVHEDVVVLKIPRVANYRISRGREIVVDPVAGSATANVRLFLLGSALAMLLHQRGLLPLHANAVVISGRAVAFMGASGAGKSTLAAWFNDRGFQVLSDDVCVVEFGARGEPLVRPGVARLRLWRDALQASGRAAGDFEPSFVGESARNKFDVPLAQSIGPAGCFELAALYLLDRGDVPTIEALIGVDAVEAVFANTYRGGYIGKVGSSGEHWSAAVRLVQKVPTFRLTRPWDMGELDEEAGRALRHAERLIDGAAEGREANWADGASSSP